MNIVTPRELPSADIWFSSMTEVRVFQQELDLATRALAPATGMLAAADPIPAPGFAALEVFLYEDSLAEELQVRRSKW